MTEEEFDKAKFSEGDEIVLKRFFKTETEPVVNVNFEYKEINGYNLKQIHKYISHYGKKEKRRANHIQPQ